LYEVVCDRYTFSKVLNFGILNFAKFLLVSSHDLVFCYNFFSLKKKKKISCSMILKKITINQLINLRFIAQLLVRLT
jgi:hypothetical protein